MPAAINSSATVNSNMQYCQHNSTQWLHNSSNCYLASGASPLVPTRAPPLGPAGGCPSSPLCTPSLHSLAMPLAKSQQYKLLRIVNHEQLMEIFEAGAK